MKSDQILHEIKNIIEVTQSILITGQANPDGDSLGAQLALHDILVECKRAAKGTEPIEIVIVNHSMPPAHYDFFPHVAIVTPFEKIPHSWFDVGFVLDAGMDRVGKVLPILENCRYTINIDHHQVRSKATADICWIEPEICSVAEMIYDFVEHPDWNASLTPDIAACLYAGIIYDTGSFRYPNTTARTHRITAKLLETGIDFSRIAERLFLEKSLPGIRLLGAVLQNIQCDASGEIIWGTITQNVLKSLYVKADQDEGIITQYAFAAGAKIAVLFKELSPNEVKVSFRSRGAIDVGRFARKMHPYGGGHPRAAGCTIKKPLSEVQQMILRALQEELR